MISLAKLKPRERALVLGGGSLLLVLGLWTYVWQPLMDERAIENHRIVRYLSVINIARTTDSAAPLEVQKRVSDVPIGPRITQSAAAAGIPLARLDPDGPRLRVTVAGAAYADLIAWISSLESSAGVRALSVEMSRLTEPGQVSLRLFLEDMQ